MGKHPDEWHSKCHLDNLIHLLYAYRRNMSLTASPCDETKKNYLQVPGTPQVQYLTRADCVSLYTTQYTHTHIHTYMHHLLRRRSSASINE